MTKQFNSIPSDLPASNNSFGRNLAILSGGELISRVAYAVAFISIARNLRPERYGQVELALAITMFLTIIVDLGLGLLGTREISRKPGLVTPLVSRVVSMQILISLCVFVMLVLMTIVLPLDPSLTYLLIGYGLTLLAFPFILNWVFQGLNQMLWITIPQVARQLLIALLVFILIRDPKQLWMLPIIEMIGLGIAVILNLMKYYSSGYKLNFSVHQFWDKGLVREALPIGGSQLIWTIRMYFPVIILGIVAGEMMVGYFAAPHRVIMAMQAFLAVYFVNLFPKMSLAASKSSSELLHLLGQSQQLVVWPSILFAISITITSGYIVKLVFGNEYSIGGTSKILAILIWMIPILVVRGHARNTLIAVGHQQDDLFTSIIGIVALIILFFLLAPVSFGFGAALAMVISELIATLLIWYKVKVRMPEVEIAKSLFSPPSLALLINPNPKHGESS